MSSSFPSASQNWQARARPELQDIVLIAGEGAISDIFIEAVGSSGIGLYMIGPHEVEGPAQRALYTAYQTAYGGPPPSFYYSFAHDAANLLLDTLETVVVRQADGTLIIGRQALRDALYDTRSYQGITGQLACDAFGDCGVPRLHIVQLDDPASGVEGLQANVVSMTEPVPHRIRSR